MDVGHEIYNPLITQLFSLLFLVLQLVGGGGGGLKLDLAFIHSISEGRKVLLLHS